MLSRLAIKGFKSLADVEVTFPRLAVLFGPNAAGKSNLLDAIQALSRIGTSRTLSDALAEPIRGYPVEAFAFSEGGLAALLSQKVACFSLDATLEISKDLYHYRVMVAIQPGSGSLTVRDEYLAALSQRGEPKGNPSIEKVDDHLRVRRKSKPANPRREPVGLNYAMLSDPRLGGVEYRAIERCRHELSGWRTYYLLKVRRGVDSTKVSPLRMTGPLFQDTEGAALASGTEDRLFESLMLRGMLDA